jgi:hypothetical protein
MPIMQYRARNTHTFMLPVSIHQERLDACYNTAWNAGTANNIIANYQWLVETDAPIL